MSTRTSHTTWRAWRTRSGRLSGALPMCPSRSRLPTSSPRAATTPMTLSPAGTRPWRWPILSAARPGRTAGSGSARTRAFGRRRPPAIIASMSPTIPMRQPAVSRALKTPWAMATARLTSTPTAHSSIRESPSTAPCTGQPPATARSTGRCFGTAAPRPTSWSCTPVTSPSAWISRRPTSAGVPAWAPAVFPGRLITR